MPFGRVRSSKTFPNTSGSSATFSMPLQYFSNFDSSNPSRFFIASVPLKPEMSRAFAATISPRAPRNACAISLRMAFRTEWLKRPSSARASLVFFSCEILLFIQFLRAGIRRPRRFFHGVREIVLFKNAERGLRRPALGGDLVHKFPVAGSLLQRRGGGKRLFHQCAGLRVAEPQNFSGFLQRLGKCKEVCGAAPRNSRHGINERFIINLKILGEVVQERPRLCIFFRRKPGTLPCGNSLPHGEADIRHDTHNFIAPEQFLYFCNGNAGRD